MTTKKNRLWHQVFAISALLLTIGSGPSKDPTIELNAGVQKLTFKRSSLLQRKDIETIEVAQDPAYQDQTRTYRAIRASSLFNGLKLADNAVIQFKCLDGFSAPISKERLLNQDQTKSLAYIALEEPGKPWPPIKPGGPSAGPFYLIWAKPGASFIGREEWPFQLAAFEVKGTLESLYPKIFPDPKLKADNPVQLGFQVFVKNCFACHTLNLSGASEIGPDLNQPMNPTEYFSKGALRLFIRNPQSVRHFPKSRMNPFPVSVLADQELDQLIVYLEHMATRKSQPN